VAQVMARGGGRRRRTMNEINMVPFIDVMLVLLIIFMVTAPLITTGVVDVPSVGASSKRPPSVVEITIGIDERLRLKIDGTAEPQPVALTQIATRALQAQGRTKDAVVIISADRNVKYDAVVRVMDTLQKAGVKRVGLSVKQGS
jgi:biopolymer transport protein TolR